MVVKKEKIKKIAFSLAEAMISMLIISVIAAMSTKLFTGQKTQKAVDMAHHIMGCYMLDDSTIAAMSMEVGKPETFQYEALKSNGQGEAGGPGYNGVHGIGNIKLFNNGYKEDATEHFNYTPEAIPGKISGDVIVNGPFCAVDVTETLASNARTVAMIGGGGFGFMSEDANDAQYNRPGDTGFFATYTNVNFSRPGIYRFYPGRGAAPLSGDAAAQAVGDSNNRIGEASRIVYTPSKRGSDGKQYEVRGSGNSNVEILAETRGGYSRNHYYPLGPIPLSDVGCDDSGSCRFEGTQLWIAADEATAAKAKHCSSDMDDDKCSQARYEGNWYKYNHPREFFAAAGPSSPNYQNYVTKIVNNQLVSYFTGLNGSTDYNAHYMGGTMIATVAHNRITIGMNDLAPRCTNDMHDFLKLTANSGAPTIFKGDAADSYMYKFGTGGACSQYHNMQVGSGGMAGQAGALFLIW